jgi:hypothetical protein
MQIGFPFAHKSECGAFYNAAAAFVDNEPRLKTNRIKLWDTDAARIYECWCGCV